MATKTKCTIIFDRVHRLLPSTARVTCCFGRKNFSYE